MGREWEREMGTENETGTGNGNGNLRKKRRRLVIEILFTNIPRDDSALTAILLMSEGVQQWTSSFAYRFNGPVTQQSGICIRIKWVHMPTSSIVITHHSLSL